MQVSVKVDQLVGSMVGGPVGMWIGRKGRQVDRFMSRLAGR